MRPRPPKQKAPAIVVDYPIRDESTFTLFKMSDDFMENMARREHIDAANEADKNVNSRIDTMENNVMEIKGIVTNINSSIDTVEGTIERLQKEVVAEGQHVFYKFGQHQRGEERRGERRAPAMVPTCCTHPGMVAAWIG